MCSFVIRAADAGRHSVVSDRLVRDIASDVRDKHHMGDSERAFQHYDEDSDGHLTKDEVIQMLSEHKDMGGFFSKHIKAIRLFNLMDTDE